jgi:hypothetical protein
MLVPRSQIEQTSEGASTLILVFEAPSIFSWVSQAPGPAYVVRQRRASGRFFFQPAKIRAHVGAPRSPQAL